jgi:hypothetical protein
MESHRNLHNVSGNYSRWRGGSVQRSKCFDKPSYIDTWYSQSRWISLRTLGLTEGRHMQEWQPMCLGRRTLSRDLSAF